MVCTPIAHINLYLFLEWKLYKLDGLPTFIGKTKTNKKVKH